MGASEVRNLTYEDFVNSVDEYLDLDGDKKLNIYKIEVDSRIKTIDRNVEN